MKYNCNICNYKTNDKSNFNKHMNCNTHIGLSSNDNNMVTNDNNKLPSHKCVKCGKIFSYRSGLSRHKKECDISLQDNSKTKELENAVMLLKSRLEKYEKVNAQLFKYVKENQPSNTTNNTFNISVKNYIQQNYSDAPALEGIKDYDKLTFEDNDFMGTLVYNFNNDTLHKYLGDFLVGYYSKENPSEQSLWNSDVSRLTYIVKELLANNKSIWNHDFKGIKVKSYIINPLLRHIKKSMNEYWFSHIDNIASGDADNLRKIQETFVTIQKIRKVIDNGILSDEIVRYIAPKFYMDKRDIITDDINDHFVDTE